VMRVDQDAPAFVDLGATAAIDELADRAQELLRDPSVELDSVKAASNAARTALWAPLAGALGDARHVYVVPDGRLSSLPLAALYDSDRRAWLDESMAISYLDSTRELLTQDADSSSRPSVVLAAPTAPSAQYALPALDPHNFPNLPGVEDELASVGRALSAQVVRGSEASEATLRSIERPRVLHIATHAFALDGSGSASVDEQRGLHHTTSSSGGPALGSVPVQMMREDDLLRSALVLSPPAPGEGSCCDGFVTAYELAALDLRGTELVTLSACQTGVGREAQGHGVASLRRALAMAGARSTVTSLWQVSDDSTRSLMARFYDELRAGAARVDALQRAMAQVRVARPHPYYWAPFTLSGRAALAGRVLVP
jgi:CHAT domain-containing protein